MSYVNRGSVLAIGITFIPLSILAVAARFKIRIQYGGLGVDDWLCLAALFIVLGACGVMIDGYATHSLGTHTPQTGPAIFTFTDPSQELVSKLEFVIFLLLIPALVLIKLSILFFYRRILRGRTFTVAFAALSVLSVIWGITFFTASAAACPTIQDNFASMFTLKTRCIDTFKVSLVQSILDVVTDLGILILPIPFVFRLQMPLNRKIVLSCTFLVGTLAISCGIARAVVSIEILSVPLFSTTTVAGLESYDIKGVVGVLCIWSVLEMGVGIIAICLPTFRPLLNIQSLENMILGLRHVIRSSINSKPIRSTRLAQASLESGGHNSVFVGRNGNSVASVTFVNDKETYLAQGSQEQNLDTSEIMVERTVILETVSR